MRSTRSGLVLLLIAFLGPRDALAQQDEGDMPPAERAYVASKIDSAIETYFAHREGVPDLDLDAAYKDYLDSALRANGRYGFDMATLEFVARLRNKHTQFDDPWLVRTHGQPLGFSAIEVEGKWAILWSRDGRLKPGDVVRAIDGVAVEAFVRDQRRFVAASSDRAARSLVFDRPYLFPRRFTLELEDGRKFAIERERQDEPPAREEPRRASEGRWLDEGRVGYLRIPSFNDTNYEKTAIEFVRTYRDARCLIVDVRGNGGGGTPWGLIGELMDREWRGWTTTTPVVVALDRARGAQAARIQTESGRFQPRAGAFAGRLLLLVDRSCCSACEDFVMPFKENGRAQIVGETTEGSSGQPFFLRLPGGMALMVGAERHRFPDGTAFESIGITPTIPVERRLDDLRMGVDTLLEKARELAAAP
ncbi:MAG TPA: S41 family peptidase [Isosphaeraceae bacterium]|jgi:carboxyl-terminal processing protease|nr:S41 family peptidase [Isosphaeraceae bacterium]